MTKAEMEAAAYKSALALAKTLPAGLRAKLARQLGPKASKPKPKKAK